MRWKLIFWILKRETKNFQQKKKIRFFHFGFLCQKRSSLADREEAMVLADERGGGGGGWKKKRWGVILKRIFLSVFINPWRKEKPFLSFGLHPVRAY